MNDPLPDGLGVAGVRTRSSHSPDPEAVRAMLESEAGGDPGPVQVKPLSGGASREVYAVETLSGVGIRRWVLRRTPPGADSFLDLEVEFDLMSQVAAAGVPVPRPVVFEPPDGRLGSAAFLMQFIEGTTIPPRVLGREELETARGLLPGQMAEALARLHSIPFAALSGLPRPDQPDPALAACELWEGQLDRIGEPLPVIEAGLRWLRLNLPDPPERRTIVHGDFRLGNLIVGPKGLRAVLDWELAHVGDPCEDLTWMAIRSWRFGRDEFEVSGLCSMEGLLSAYEAAGRPRPGSHRLHWWSVMNNVKWAVICARQAADQRAGARQGHELAALGRRIAEPEWDLLGAISPSGMAA